MRGFSDHGKIFVWVSVIFVIGGLICLVFGIIYDVRYATYPTAEAVVVDVDYKYDDEGELMACPVYRYEVNGEVYTMKGNGYESAWACPKEGSTKTIRYNPRKPYEIIDSVLLPIVLTVLGVLATAGGASVLIKKRKDNNSAAD